MVYRRVLARCLVSAEGLGAGRKVAAPILPLVPSACKRTPCFGLGELARKFGRGFSLNWQFRGVAAVLAPYDLGVITGMGQVNGPSTWGSPKPLSELPNSVVAFSLWGCFEYTFRTSS